MPGSLSVRRKNTTKARANGPSAVERQVQKLFGLKPGQKRLAVLPDINYSKSKGLEFTAPQVLYDLARAFTVPGVAMSGQPIDAESEATNFALNFTGSGALGSQAARGALGEGRAVLGMSGTPKSSRPPSLLSAVRAQGKTYTGPTHLDALRAIPDPKVRAEATLDANSRGFVNERGRFLDRYKAADYARNFDLFSPDAPDWARTAPEVISENLRLPDMPSRNLQGIIAYHGSPHSFDRFDISKIGTGEGNQAYGRGLYFAENEGVAKQYRDDVTAQQARLRGGLSPTRPVFVTPKGEIAEGHPDYVAAKLVSDARNYAVGNDWIKNEIGLLGLDRYGNGADIMRRVRRLQKSDLVKNEPLGAMYQVRINANPEDFLDWDRPLREQPKALEALNQFDLSSLKEGNRTRTMLEWARRGEEQEHNLAKGRDFMIGMDNTPGNNFSVNPSEFLKAEGFPGVRYLDEGSREIGDGTRNYAVFDDALIDLLRRYAIGGKVSGR